LGELRKPFEFSKSKKIFFKVMWFVMSKTIKKNGLNLGSFKEISIQISYLNLAAKCWGNPEGSPLLGFHGWLDNAATFDHLAPLLNEYYFVSLDLPGHGFSDHRPSGSSYHFIDMIVDVLEVLNFLNWDRFSLIGHSMGAGVASYLAGTVPEKIISLVLIEGLGSITQEAKKMPETLFEASTDWMKLKNKKLPIYPDFETAVKVRRSVGVISDSSVRTLVARGLKPVMGGFSWNSDPRLKLKSRYYFTEEQSLAFLQKIKAPVLLIDSKGSKKDSWKESYRKRICHIKNFHYRKVNGDHHLHLDNPEAVAEVIIDFTNKSIKNEF